MPTGNCRFPEHHSGGSSAGPPLGLLLAIAAGALIITHVHAVLVTLAVVAALAVAGVAVVMMVHSHRGQRNPRRGLQRRRAWKPQDAVVVTRSRRTRSRPPRRRTRAASSPRSPAITHRSRTSTSTCTG